MKKLLAITALMLAFVFPYLVWADSYETVPGTSLAAKWDTTSGAFVSLGVGGQPTTQTPLATLTGAQTLTNKTLTNPVINGPVPVACGSTCTITAANSGATILLNTASGSVATLPAATGTGNGYKFVVSTTVTSNSHKILAASTSDDLTGTEIGWTGSTAKIFSCGASTYHAIQMPYSAGSGTSGGYAGDVFYYTDIATNLWLVQGVYQGETTPTTPCSATNS